MAILYLYCRTSTKEQKYGIETQKQFLRDNIPKKYVGYPVMEIVEQISGKTLEGRKLEKLIESLLSNDVIFFYDTSRIARNTEDLLFIIKKIYEKKAHIIIGLQELDPENYEQELQLSISGAVATYQRKVQNAKSRAGIKVKKNNGEWVFGGRLYGYRVSKDKIEKIEDEAKILRRIYTEYAAGRSTNSIITKLNDEGVTLRGGQFYAASVRRMILNPIYMGFYSSEKFNIKKDYRKEKLIKSEKYPEIIDTDLWWRVYDSYRELPRKHAVQFAYRWSEHELSGILKCGYCGAGYVHSLPKNWSKKIVPYYSCRVHKKGCEQKFHNFQEAILVKLFELSFDFFSENQEDFICFIKEEKAKQETENARINAKVDLLKSELDEIDNKIDVIVEQIINFSGQKTVAQKLKVKSSELEIKKNEIQSQIINLENSLTQEIDPDTLSNYRDELIKRYKESVEPEERRAIYRKVIVMASIMDGELDILFYTGKNIIIPLQKRAGKYVQKEFLIRVLARDAKSEKRYIYNFDNQKLEYESEITYFSKKRK